MVLQSSGVNTDIYKAHSTRAATTSAAMEKRVPIANILAVAGRSNVGTFETFYHKPVASVFQQKVMQG